MLRTALRRARPASSVAPRRGIASGLNLLQLPTSDLQPARTWDAAEADGVCAASFIVPSPPSRLLWPRESRRPDARAESAPGAPPSRAPRAGFAGTSLQKLFAGRKVVLFALPGAFTGVCERGHVPSFAKLVDDFQQKGVDEVVCLAINDPYCMNGWATAMQTKGISFYADADESFTRAVSETRDCTGDALGPGLRSNRYACVVEDGVVGACFVEAGPGDLEVSDGATLLKAL